MSNKRRDLLKAGAGVAAAAAFPMIWIKDAHAQWNSQPEKGAKLRVLRWSRFVQGDIDQYMRNVQAFTAKYGIEVRVDSESGEEVRPTAPAPARTSFSAPTTTPISIPRSWWTSPTCATTWAKNTAAGTRRASSISSPTASAGSASPSARPAA